MAVMSNKRSIMTLYSGSTDMESHRTRIVLAEKGILADVIEVERCESIEDLYNLNPYNTVPTLVDRDLVLFQSPIIMEYLDERFPHPPLLPVYPVSRAKSRLMVYRIEHDWYTLVDKIQHGDAVDAEKARKELVDSMISIAPVFTESEYLFNEDFSLIDCSLAPLLWRLPSMGVKLEAPQAKPINDYAKRIFKRRAFQSSLTESERELRD